MAREIGTPRGGAGGGSGPPTPEETSRILIKFALIELPGVLALLGFFVLYFVLDVFPGRPPALLVGAIVVFAAWVLFAMWVSGFFRLFQKR